MKANNLWWILAVLLVSCVYTSERPIPPLLHADSLIRNGSADSALILLESINLSTMDTELLKAWYALLVTQANDKNYVTHSNDSLIRIAIDYFNQSDDLLLKARAHYYCGRVYQDMGDVEGAVREFLTAVPFAEKIGDYELTILLKSNLGLLCWENGLQYEADSLYGQAMELAEAHSDSLRLIIALVKRADICIENGEASYDIAADYLQRALRLAENLDNRYSKNIVYSSLSYLSEYQGKLQDAISWANKGMMLDEDTLQRQGYYLVLGSAYARSGQYDSARVYLNRCIYSENYYTIASAYMKLSEVAKALGDSNEALEYEMKYGVYKDSIKLLEQPVQLVSSLKDILYNQSMERYESFIIQYRLYLLITLFLLVLFVIYFVFKRKKKNKEIALIIEKNKTLYSNIEVLKQELGQKNEEVKDMHQHCLAIETTAKQKEQLESCMKELLEQQKQIQNELEQQIKEKDIEVVRLRNLNLRYALSLTPIYKRLTELGRYNKKNPDNMEKVTSLEWETLSCEINNVSLGFVDRLRSKFERLSEEDIHFCCLVRLEFKYSEIALIWGCSSVAVYKRSSSILDKMGMDKGVKLSEVLNSV